MPTPLLGDRGSLLLLQVLMVTVLVAAVGVVADVGRVIGERQQLAATADQAAIAGAQAIDLGDYYLRGAQGGGAVRLHPDSARAAVQRFLAPAISAGQQQDLRIADVEVVADGLAVRLQCQAALPFGSLLGIRSVPVTASATARLDVQPPA